MGRIIENYRWQYDVDPLRFLHLEEREHKIPEGITLVSGPAPYDNFMHVRDNHDKVISLFIEEPNTYFVHGTNAIFDDYNNFDLQLTICPYTTKWGNKKRCVFFPFDRRYEVHLEKKYDVMYSGGIHSNLIIDIADAMSMFNYQFVCFNNHPLVTFSGGTYHDKIKMISESKMQVVHNLLFLNQNHVNNVKTLPKYTENEAFSHLDEFLVPQLKIRALESAFLKSVILCKRDHWNIIETMFSPDEFVYWDNKDDLEDKIHYISTNFHQFESMIEKAYQRAIKEYTVDNFIEKFIF
jgi:spore maturation protein CgeB